MGIWSRLKARLFGQSQFQKNIAALERRVTDAAHTGPAPAAPGASNGEPVRETFGVTPADPVLCNQPSGEHAYIGSLRCPQGHRLRGPRIGSMQGKCSDPRHHASLFPAPDEDPAERCLVDRYDLRCDGGEFSCTLYFDMYHPGAPPQPAPRGMTRGWSRESPREDDHARRHRGRRDRLNSGSGRHQDEGLSAAHQAEPRHRRQRADGRGGRALPPRRRPHRPVPRVRPRVPRGRVRRLVRAVGRGGPARAVQLVGQRFRDAGQPHRHDVRHDRRGGDGGGPNGLRDAQPPRGREGARRRRPPPSSSPAPGTTNRPSKLTSRPNTATTSATASTTSARDTSSTYRVRDRCRSRLSLSSNRPTTRTPSATRSPSAATPTRWPASRAGSPRRSTAGCRAHIAQPVLEKLDDRLGGVVKEFTEKYGSRLRR